MASTKRSRTGCAGPLPAGRAPGAHPSTAVTQIYSVLVALGRRVVFILHQGGMQLLVPTASVLTHWDVPGHLRESQSSSSALLQGDSPRSPPGVSGNVLSPQGAKEPAGDPALPRGPPAPHGPCEPRGARADGSIISIPLLFARGSCNQRLRVYSGKINHNC